MNTEISQGNSMKTIVFCTTCKNRYQHLKETLPKNLADNNLPTTKFVVLDYNSADDMAVRIEQDFAKEIASGRLIYYKYHENYKFKMAHAKNLAHRLGLKEGADILVNLDADNFTGPNFDQYILNQLDSEPNSFLWANMVKGVMPKGISGRIVCTKHQFLIGGGYDEKYENYSPDDKDYKARLVRLEFKPLEIDAIYLNAIRHNDKMRFKEYPESKNPTSEDFQIDQKNTVVNYGKVGCGMVTRNFDYTAINIRPIPTRIFGIGTHKTATTSLHKAFQILGFKSSHWENAHWARAIWSEMKERGKSLTVEQSYALSDLPISVLYKELDRAYPGSKFILTTRPESSWIESIRKHWSPEYNPFRSQWKIDPFTNFIHKVLYGQTEFNEGLFLQKYREHNHEVVEYFKDRPDDLLVMEKPEWEGLCDFLSIEIPSVPYPNANVTPDIIPPPIDPKPLKPKLNWGIKFNRGNFLLGVKWKKNKDGLYIWICPLPFITIYFHWLKK